MATLKDETGLWLTGEPLTQHITNAFKKLFQTTSPHMCPTFRNTLQRSHRSPFLTHTRSLTSIPPLAEILRNLQGLPPLKALGPDGYHALFFQHNWLSLGPSIIQVIQEIFEQLTIPPNWGLINLVLLPKVAHPELITQFRPINHCNTLYKLLSRIIVQRLKPYMAEVINPCQAGFVSGR